MQITKEYRRVQFLEEQLTPEQDKDLVQKFLSSFSGKIESSDEITTILYKVLVNLFNKNQLHMQFINRNNISNNIMNLAYGYYNSYENNIYIMVDKDTFESKWLGLATDYSTIKDVHINAFITTCLHELIHFICTNYFNSFMSVWKSVFHRHIWYIFTYLINNNFYGFVDKETFKNISPKSFIEDPNFKKAFDQYFNSISVNMRFKIRSDTKRYNDILSTLYSKQNFKFGRFVDNVLINAMRIKDQSFGKTSTLLYQAIAYAYISLEPNLNNNLKELNKILFWQELFDFSEIACVFATIYKYCPIHSKHVKETLLLV